jgi:hypothetical protein
MPRALQATTLAAGEVDRSYPLILSGGTGFSLQGWRRYAGSLVKHGPIRCGLLAVKDQRGTILGICSYRMQRAPEGGQLCAVELIVALDLIDESEVAIALLDGIEALARRQEANAMSVSLPYASKLGLTLLARLGDGGLQLHQLRLLKSFLPLDAGRNGRQRRKSDNSRALRARNRDG